MEEPDEITRCPKCRSTPVSFTKLSADQQDETSPMVLVRGECECGHSWTIKRIRHEWE